MVKDRPGHHLHKKKNKQKNPKSKNKTPNHETLSEQYQKQKEGFG
jgi:hypothetical protein